MALKVDREATRRSLRAPARPAPEGPPWTRLRTRPSPALVLQAALGLLLALAAWQLTRRVPFRWDMYIWSESPFLTSMLKLANGQTPYTSPSDANSFVYSPGLEYLTYGLLRPFGRHLDIRYCRAVSVGFAALAALALARGSVVLAEALFPGERIRRLGPTAAAFAFLVIYRNLTSDVPHPDNLHIGHAAITLCLSFEALRRRSPGFAAAAVMFGGLGVLAKQVAVLGGMGAWAALAVTLPSDRRVRTASWLFALAAATTAGSVAALWSIGWGRFYTFEVVSSHGLLLREKGYFLLSDALFDYRVLPLALASGAVAWCLRWPGGLAPRLAAVYLALLVAELGPSVTAYLKPMGAWNNLVGMEAWAVVPVMPLLLACLQGAGPFGRLGGLERGFKPAALAVGLVLAACFAPRKLPPTPEHVAHCRTIQRLVALDLRGGKRVLVAHGAEFLIRNGDTGVPLDRANSCLELLAAGKDGLAGTERRIEAKYYDTIYLNSDWYPPRVREAIGRNYRPVTTVPGTPDQNRFWYENGYQGLTIDTRVLVKRS